MLALVDDDPAIDDDVLNAFAVLERLLVRRTIAYSLLVEDRDVRKQPRLQQAAVANSDFRGVERSHFAHGIFKPEQTAFAHVNAQHARKRAEAARVRIAASQRPLYCQRGTVRADRAPRLAQREVHVFLRVVRIDRAYRSVLLDEQIEQNVER